MKYILLTLIIIYNISLAKSQDSDTLTLSETIERVLETYPSILQADDEIKISEVNLKLAKDNYLPSLSGKASYLWMDPISSLDMNDKTIHIQAHNNTPIGITLSLLIWDFGKTRPKIEAARLQKQISELQKEQLMQNLSLEAIQSYYMTGYTRHSITVKEKQLEDYGKLLIQTEVKKNTGAATNFDYLNTNAEFNAVKTELIALNTAKDCRKSCVLT